ncbi:hypothetical protein [Blastococcus deserti]
MKSDRSATLVLRVWLESGSDDFRGRLTAVDTTVGHEGGEVTLGVVSSASDAVEAVRAWLDDFVGGRAPSQ